MGAEIIPQQFNGASWVISAVPNPAASQRKANPDSLIRL